jgi:hypothetical protein
VCVAVTGRARGRSEARLPGSGDTYRVLGGTWPMLVAGENSDVASMSECRNITTCPTAGWGGLGVENRDLQE